MKIFKYPVPIKPEFTLEMPMYAKVIAYQVQGGMPVIWAEVEETNDKVERKFITLGTGHEAPEFTGAHIGTIQLDGLVWHLYESREYN